MNLNSKTIRLRFVEVEDAEFILKLRMDERYNKYLSSVAPDVQAQRDWISAYKVDEREKRQFYFIIERNDGIPCGTVRIYDLRKESFCWGSWILNEDKTRYAALESALLVHEFGFEELGYEKSHFEIRKGNEKSININKRLGAVLISEDKENFYFEISKESLLVEKNKFLSDFS